MDGEVLIDFTPLRSQLLNVIRSLMFPSKDAAESNAKRVLLSAYRTRADVSETVPTSLQVLPLSVE